MADLNAEVESMLTALEFQVAQLREIFERRHIPAAPAILTHDGSAGVPLDADDPPSRELL